MALPYADSPAVKPLGSTVPAGKAPAGPAGEEGGAGEGGDVEHEAKLEASERATAAATSGDAAGFADAMEDFVRICVRKYGKN